MIRIIFNTFAGGLAWFVLGFVLLTGAWFAAGFASAEALGTPAAQVVSSVSENGAILPGGGQFEFFTSPALMSYGLGALVLLWAVAHHRQQRTAS